MIAYGDFHVHTPFCPHGSNDQWEHYILNAIKLGLSEISFTEHAPLPISFQDPVPNQDSAMAWSDLDMYLKKGEQLKLQYKEDIKINIGFEVDYIDGYQEEIQSFLDQYGKQIDDAILSVHMLKAPDNQYVCLDYSATEFANIIKQFQSIEAVYKHYYQTVLSSITVDLGQYKPQRIGHLTLIEKFALKYPSPFNDQTIIDEVLNKIKANHYSLDLNTAGLYKPDCLSVYPKLEVARKAKEIGIELIPGSDSHQSTTIGRGFEQIRELLKP
ncbi:histidinol-phosphatase HisJ [Amphibacillus cookii]|uniref:histidinol-phosphatase HisJ n=1 Tax=Amphibacillus cookii TaxID=767787 RepID=UPI00195C1791|nr:histidinol-phosphatase HisJ [Amphibacillus cookii]MBM7540796.1 histidinol-phosphatase (PHP family) [Amphibacillus cookii]